MLKSHFANVAGIKVEKFVFDQMLPDGSPDVPTDREWRRTQLADIIERETRIGDRLQDLDDLQISVSNLSDALDDFINALGKTPVPANLMQKLLRAQTKANEKANQ